MDASRLRIMKLLNLSARHAEFPEIESHLKQDAALTVRLLRFINSPAVGLRYPVRSIGHALLMLGHDQLYRWLTLLLFVHESAGQGRNLALLRNALIRARFTENLGAARMPPDLRDGLFIVGILSMLDALLGLPMSQAVEGLNLAEPIVEALLRGEGPYAGWLALAVACERRDPGAIGRLGASLGVDAQAVNLAHIEALIWAEGMDL
jgi:EAL and modified HD-GYP domain-containing signal transduction protein